MSLDKRFAENTVAGPRTAGKDSGGRSSLALEDEGIEPRSGKGKRMLGKKQIQLLYAEGPGQHVNVD